MRSCGSFSVALTGLVSSQPQPGKQGFLLGFDGPPVAILHPIVVPWWCTNARPLRRESAAVLRMQAARAARQTPTWLNHRQLWPTLQTPVPLAQLQPQPSVPLGTQPLGTCEFQPGCPGLFGDEGCAQCGSYGYHLPPLQRGSDLSTAFRGNGVTRLMWADARPARWASRRAEAARNNIVGTGSAPASITPGYAWCGPGFV